MRPITRLVVCARPEIRGSGGVGGEPVPPLFFSIDVDNIVFVE